MATIIDTGTSRVTIISGVSEFASAYTQLKRTVPMRLF